MDDLTMSSVESILLCEPRFIDPAQGSGLWWTESMNDVQSYPINTVCLSSLHDWPEVSNPQVQRWISRFPFVFVASPRRELVEMVKKYVRAVPILSPSPTAFQGYENLTAFKVEGQHSDSEVEQLLYGATWEPAFGILELSSVERADDRNTPRKLSGFRQLDRLTGGFRAGELSVWTGRRGEGKSTLLGQILLDVLDQGGRVFAYSGELPSVQFKAWELVQAAGPDNLDTFSDPDTGEPIFCARDWAADEIDRWWKGRFFLTDIGTDGAHDEDRILDDMAYAVRVHGCDSFLIDNLMTARLKSDRDFYRAQSAFAQRLSRFAKANSVHIHLIAHPRKADKTAAGIDPDDVAGSGDVTNIADNVFAVLRLKDEEAQAHGFDAVVSVLKSRHNGKRGKVGLRFDPASRRFYAPGESPRKRYGWEYSKQETFTEIDGEPVPF